MTDKKYPLGSIVSADITVQNAEGLRDFYENVVGWNIEEMQLKDESGPYTDYVMKDGSGNWAAGICHLRGPNTDMPPQWIVYVNVEDIERSVEKCKEFGGAVCKEQRNDRGILIYALIQDPTGAILALTKVE